MVRFVFAGGRSFPEDGLQLFFPDRAIELREAFEPIGEEFLAANERAREQWRLEGEFAKFEKKTLEAQRQE